jgi:hypothetical protein
LRLVGNEAEAETTEHPLHPLHRIMGIEERPEEVVVMATQIYLARRIAMRSSTPARGRWRSTSTRRATSRG